MTFLILQTVYELILCRRLYADQTRTYSIKI